MTTMTGRDACHLLGPMVPSDDLMALEGFRPFTAFAGPLTRVAVPRG